MLDKHWTDEELLLRLFDVEQPDNHLEVCPDCSRRWEAMRSRYESRPAISAGALDERLAAQRSTIRARLENKRKFRPILAPSLAALAVIVLIAALVFPPKQPKQPEPKAMSEDEMFEDMFRTAFNIEPEAIRPVQSLFEVPQ
jgi:hypothetical protein